MAPARQYSNEQMKAALTETKGLIYLAAKKLGCDPHTIRNRMKVSPDLVQHVADQRGEFVDTGEASLYRAVVQGEPWAVALVLKTLGKDRGYVERSETRHGGDESAPPLKHEHTLRISVDDFRKLPFAERVRLLRAAGPLPLVD